MRQSIFLANRARRPCCHACASPDVAGSIRAPYVMPYENERLTFICRGLDHNLSAVWNHFKRYD